MAHGMTSGLDHSRNSELLQLWSSTSMSFTDLAAHFGCTKGVIAGRIKILRDRLGSAAVPHRVNPEKLARQKEAREQKRKRVKERLTTLNWERQRELQREFLEERDETRRLIQHHRETAAEALMTAPLEAPPKVEVEVEVQPPSPAAPPKPRRLRQRPKPAKPAASIGWGVAGDKMTTRLCPFPLWAHGSLPLPLSDRRYCGVTKAAGSHWCPEHQEIATREPGAGDGQGFVSNRKHPTTPATTMRKEIL